MCGRCGHECKMTEDRVKNILRFRNSKLKNIHQKMISLYEDANDTDSVLETVALPAQNIRVAINHPSALSPYAQSHRQGSYNHHTPCIHFYAFAPACTTAMPYLLFPSQLYMIP